MTPDNLRKCSVCGERGEKELRSGTRLEWRCEQHIPIDTAAIRKLAEASATFNSPVVLRAKDALAFCDEIDDLRARLKQTEDALDAFAASIAVNAELRAENGNLHDRINRQGETILTCKTENAKLREALKPFAEVGIKLGDDPRYGDQNTLDDWDIATFKDCRRARDVLGEG
jgi:hypothetical protein